MANPFNVPLNTIPYTKSKYLLRLAGGDVLIMYFTNAQVEEGTPMKVVSGSVYDKSTHNLAIELAVCVPGNNDGARCLGLSIQRTYAEQLSGQMSQLSGFHFPNDTAQRLAPNGGKSSPIGILGGRFHAAIRNYSGTPTPEGQGYVGASGTIATSGASGDKLPLVFETAPPSVVPYNTDPTIPGLVRIRADFPLFVLSA